MLREKLPSALHVHMFEYETLTVFIEKLNLVVMGSKYTIYTHKHFLTLYLTGTLLESLYPTLE